MINEDNNCQFADNEDDMKKKTEHSPEMSDAAQSEETVNLTEEVSEGTDNSSDVADAPVDWQDRYLRLSAEFDNYRKRTLKEKMDLIATGGEDVIVSILGVLDDMDRAVDAMDKSDNIESAREGMKLIHQKLVDVLRQKGVSEIPARDLELDTDLYEAVAKFPCEEADKGKIIDVVQKGYKLKDKVIRFCKVVVGE